MQSARHNAGRDTKRIRLFSMKLMWAVLLIAAAIISCKKDPEESRTPEKRGDVFKADFAGKAWQADSLSIDSPKDSVFMITGAVRKSYPENELFMLGFSRITAPGKYAMEVPEKSRQVEAIFLKTSSTDVGIYKSISGAVQVTHIDASGIRGTFTAQMQAGPGQTLAIDNGQFDIDFAAMMREQTALLAGIWKGYDYIQSWATSKEGVRGAVYHPKKKQWLINKSVLEFAADGTYQALHEKQQRRWRLERPGVLSLNGRLCRVIVTPAHLQIIQLSNNEMKAYTRIQELPGLE